MRPAPLKCVRQYEPVSYTHLDVYKRQQYYSLAAVDVDAVFLGEVIHGDYPAMVAESRFDSVTQYEPVSYTHLDVYKRQRQHREVQGRLGGGAGASDVGDQLSGLDDLAFGDHRVLEVQVVGRDLGVAADGAAVSYTHLDVYKRQ